VDEVSNELQAALLIWAFAVPFWALFWVIWTGRLRWLNDNLFGPYAVSLLPATALAATVMGFGALVGAWLFLLGGAVFVLGLVLWLVAAWADPVWLQPPWYRQERAAGEVDTRGRGAALLAAVARTPSRPSGFGSDRWEGPAILVTGEATRPAAVAARNGRIGRLFVCERALVFVQADSETMLRGAAEPTAIPWHDVTDIDVVRLRRGPAAWWSALRNDPRGRRLLRITTGAGHTHLRVTGLDRSVAAIDDARRNAGASA
jgi:hypothetical protein